MKKLIEEVKEWMREKVKALVKRLKVCLKRYEDEFIATIHSTGVFM